MAFRVEIAPQALEDLDEIADYIKAAVSFETAQVWFNGIIDEIRSLRQMPGRCARAEESDEIGADVRVLLHGKRNRRYKVYFAIRRETQAVHVFHVRHWARKPLSEDALQDLIETG
jgi:plasmid stabilization system protein ParE